MQKSLGSGFAVGERLAFAGDLVDPQAQHGGHVEIMHRYADDVFVGGLQFRDEFIG